MVISKCALVQEDEGDAKTDRISRVCPQIEIDMLIALLLFPFIYAPACKAEWNSNIDLGFSGGVRVMRSFHDRHPGA
jgi:hypothetical protein